MSSKGSIFPWVWGGGGVGLGVWGVGDISSSFWALCTLFSLANSKVLYSGQLPPCALHPDSGGHLWKSFNKTL